MMNDARWGMAAALGSMLMAFGAHAQPKPDPLNGKAAVPAAVHRSALSDYRARYPVEAVPWREANDTVTRIGGWRVYTREAHAAPPGNSAVTAPSPASVIAPTAAPIPQPVAPKPVPGHGAHGKH